MLTCYECAKGINGTVKTTQPHSMSRATGFDFRTGKVTDLDFSKSFHPECYARAEKLAATQL